MNSQRLISQFEKRFPDEATCLRHFVEVRFRNGRYCPYCGSLNTYEYGKSDRYRCGSCRKDFNALSRTIFENSHLDLRQYLLVLALLTESKSEIPLKEIVEAVGTTEKSARRVIRLMRNALKDMSVVPNGMSLRKGTAAHGQTADAD